MLQTWVKPASEEDGLWVLRGYYDSQLSVGHAPATQWISLPRFQAGECWKMTEIMNQCSCTSQVGYAAPTPILSSGITAASAERPLGTIIRCYWSSGKEYSKGVAANLQLASPSLFTWRMSLYQNFQENENFWTQVLALAWVAGGGLRMTYRVSVDILMTPNGQEFLLPLCRRNTGQVSQKTLNPAKIQDSSNVIQSNQVVAIIQSITEAIYLSKKVRKPLTKEHLTKPSSTMKIEQKEIPDCASIQGSIIPCVKDIETGKVSTKGHFTVQLMGKALQEFSQNHRIIKFQVEVGLLVNDEDSGDEVVPSSSPDSSASSKKMESFNIRNKKGQLKCLIDLIHHKDLIQITQSTVYMDITYSITVLVS